MVATDLDGTLLRSDGTVSTAPALRCNAAAEAGLVVAFVTGRPPRWLDVLAESTGYVGVAVGANGAVLYDMTEERLVTAHLLDPALMVADGQRPARRVRRGHASPSSTATGSPPSRSTCTTGRSTRPTTGAASRSPSRCIGPLAEIARRSRRSSCSPRTRRPMPDAMLAAATVIVGDRATITHSSSFGLVEIVGPRSHQGDRAGRDGRVARDRRRTRSWPSATCPTTCRCCVGRPRLRGRERASRGASTVADEVIGSNDDDAVAELIESLLR